MLCKSGAISFKAFLPSTLKHLTLKEGSDVTESFVFPEDLESLDVLSLISREVQVKIFSNPQHLPQKLKRVRAAVAPKLVAALSGLTHLALDGNNGRANVLDLPSQLRELELHNFADFDFSAIATCTDLRRLFIKNSGCSRPDWSKLPKNLFQISIVDIPYEKRWPKMSVSEWVKLPVFCSTIPRLDSVMEGLVQFSEV